MLYRLDGTLERASPPAMRNSHSWCGELIPPGRRQAMPQMAIGRKGKVSLPFSALE